MDTDENNNIPEINSFHNINSSIVSQENGKGIF